MYQEWFKKFEETKDINKKIRKVKNKSKLLDKIMKLCKKNNLELRRDNEGNLIIMDFLKLEEQNMLSKNEKEKIEEAINNILCGIDIESSALILEKSVMDNYIISRGRVNILKIATRQILNFIEEYKNKGYLDVVREKVKAKEKITKLQKENEEKDNQIDLMIEEYEYNARINFKNFCEDELRKDNCIQDCKSCAKQYFEKLVKEKG